MEFEALNCEMFGQEQNSVEEDESDESFEHAIIKMESEAEHSPRRTLSIRSSSSRSRNCRDYITREPIDVASFKISGKQFHSYSGNIIKIWIFEQEKDKITSGNFMTQLVEHARSFLDTLRSSCKATKITSWLLINLN